MTIWQIAFCVLVVVVGALLGFLLGALTREKRLRAELENRADIIDRLRREKRVADNTLFAHKVEYDKLAERLKQAEEEQELPAVIRVENRFPEHITASVEIPMEHAENTEVIVAAEKQLKELIGRRAYAAANKIYTDNIIGMKKVITADLMVVRK